MNTIEHIKATHIKGRTVTFIVDDVGSTVNDLASQFGLKGKNLEAKVAHQLGLQIKEQTGAGRIKVLFATAVEKAQVLLPKFSTDAAGHLKTE